MREDLKSAGFAIKPYYLCVVNRIINGSQITVTWHVDDLKVLHKDGWESTILMKWLEKLYGDIKVKRGRKHQCLGIDLDFECIGKVMVSMIPWCLKPLLL